ncbi:RAN GTPase-activating protein 2 [Diplonema papillatum]|nr:RAN GTPase-activating protein 2 [Diplonema papillatum]|eukprot:gene21071-32466_t
MDEMFEEHVTVDTIDIRLEDLTDEGIGKLIDWCKKEKRDLKAVKEIDLGNNFIEPPLDNLALLLKQTSNADNIDLRENKITKSGIYQLQQPLLDLRKLAVLSLNGCQLWDYGADVAFNAASQMPALRALHLVDNFFSSEAGKHVGDFLKKNTPLAELFLDYNKFGDDGAALVAAGLRVNRRLRKLGMNDNGIGDDGAASLAAALAHGRPGSAGLHLLDLSVNQIGEKGAAALSDALVQNTSLLHLDVGANPLYGAGGAAMVKFLETNRTLTCLDLTNVNLDNESAPEIVASVSQNVTVRDIPLYVNEEMDMSWKEQIARVFVCNREHHELQSKAAAARKVAEKAKADLRLTQRRARIAQLGVVLLPLLLLAAAVAFAVYYLGFSPGTDTIAEL